MDIFSAKRKSFKLHRDSPFASKLKSSISVKLSQFLADYKDDVLAEYITVLVCNGKHQYRAKEDLEVFLGDRTVEFVSWLWNLILENAGQFSVVSYKDKDRYKGASTDRGEKFHSCSTGHADEIVMKDNRTYHVSTCDPVSSENMKLAKGSQHHPSFCAASSEVNTKRALSGTCVNKINQILNQQASELPKEPFHFTNREAVYKNTQFFTSVRPCPKQVCASYNFGSSLSPRFVGVGSSNSEKPRRSVWDRLGKPCEEISVVHKSVDFYGVGHKKQDGKVHNQLALILPMRNPEAPTCGKRSYSYPVETKNWEHGGSAVGEPHFANNIGRKRLFGEIGTGPGTGSGSLVHERNFDTQCHVSQDFKKSNLTKKGPNTTQILVSEVLDVKQRLHQIEMEMSRLQSKQVEIEKKDGKLNHSSSSGIFKDSEESNEIESRTVLVTNVHFSATKEALSLFFANYGGVVNVVMLTDKFTAKPKGSAYVTFASKESVDKAVALSGTTFYSRIVKVLRKTDAASMESAPTQLSAKTFHAHVPQVNRNTIPNKARYPSSSLQWRREARTDPSEPPSASDSVKGDSSSLPKTSF